MQHHIFVVLYHLIGIFTGAIFFIGSPQQFSFTFQKFVLMFKQHVVVYIIFIPGIQFVQPGIVDGKIYFQYLLVIRFIYRYCLRLYPFYYPWQYKALYYQRNNDDYESDKQNEVTFRK